MDAADQFFRQSLAERTSDPAQHHNTVEEIRAEDSHASAQHLHRLHQGVMPCTAGVERAQQVEHKAHVHTFDDYANENDDVETHGDKRSKIGGERWEKIGHDTSEYIIR
eukprot:TRINITY_DN1380_c0_g1_i1.p1 TRINITY_DN1380_c0_g1~~TRINITY_DN1380_c0_g1_i1.p1  ORF type:complete len:109 (-),score=19.37 TRINITY_DN1380_c0_g1_i1:121-447(-)